jgi:hypothetical protein
MRTWVLPAIYTGVAVAFAGVVAFAHLHTSGGWLFRYIVEGDQHRILSARVLSLFVVLGGVAALLRTNMRGVVIHPDGVETRDVVGLAWPKVKNCSWAELDEVIFDGQAVGFRLWDGSSLWLPPVRDHQALRRALERVAVARGIPMRGDDMRPVEEVEAELDELGAGRQSDG